MVLRQDRPLPVLDLAVIAHGIHALNGAWIAPVTIGILMLFLAAYYLWRSRS